MTCYRCAEREALDPPTTRIPLDTDLCDPCAKVFWRWFFKFLRKRRG